MPKISFIKASQRLHQDASHLRGDSTQDRNASAGHFFGLSSECGLKYLLLVCGALNRDSTTGDLLHPRPHVNQLVDASGLVATYASAVANHTNAKYLAQMPNLGGLSTWKVEFRYYDTSHTDYPKQEELKWETAATEIQKALDQAQLDGQPIY